jgi:hypothetical protein
MHSNPKLVSILEVPGKFEYARVQEKGSFRVAKWKIYQPRWGNDSDYS